MFRGLDQDSLGALLFFANNGMELGSVSDQFPDALTRDLATGISNDTNITNWAALLGVGLMCERVFLAPLPFAPGLTFVGAQFDLARWTGVASSTPRWMGAGGTGENSAVALARCFGEVAEMLGAHERQHDGRLNRESRNAVMCRAWRWPHHKMPDLPASDCLRRADRVSGSEGRMLDSAGWAAGATLADAVRHGVLELFEREAVSAWWFGGKRARSVPDLIINDDRARQMINSADRAASRPVRFLDVSLRAEFPTVVALSHDMDGKTVVVGACADVDPVSALLGAFREMCQMELAQMLAVLKKQQSGIDNLASSDLEWIERYDGHNLYDFPQFTPVPDSGSRENATGSNQLKFEECLEKYERDGREVIVADISGVFEDVRNCRVLMREVSEKIHHNRENSDQDLPVFPSPI